MTHDSPEFDAALAVTELEKSKADGIKSLRRAEKAEAALARVVVLIHNTYGAVSVADVRAAMKEPK